MKDVRFQNFDYTAVDDLPEGVVFFGTDGAGLFHQMTRNAAPCEEGGALNDAVDDTIEQAKALAEDGVSVGFDPPVYRVANGTPYARTSSVLTSDGGLSLAENIFFLDADRVLCQVQCGTLMTRPVSALSHREGTRERLDSMIDTVIGEAS